jgi:hypothetical protein
MKNIFTLATIGSVSAVLALSACSTQEEMPAKPAPAAKTAPAAPAAKAEAKEAKETTDSKAPGEKAPEKAKATKVAGDVGLLDTEKNYMILVTKEGKLVTIDFDPKTKATQIDPTPAKIADVGLGSSAVVVYEQAGEKNVATSLEYKPAKGE